MSDKSLRFLLFGEDVTAGKTMGDVAGKGEKSSKRIGAAFGKVGSQIGGEFGDVLDRIGLGIDKLSEGGKAAKVMATGTAIGGLGVALQSIGSSDKQATDQLNQAIKDTGRSASDYKDEIEKTIKSQENFGHSAVDTQTALQKLTQSTNDPKKALDTMGVVANLAAAKHISLSDAATMVSKILAGKGGKALSEYGIVMGKGTDKTKLGQAALEALAKKIDGQASASMDNFGAKVGVVKTKLGDWAAQMGQKLGPALTAIGPILAIVGAGMEIMSARKAAAAVATQALAVAQTEEAVTTEAATVAQGGLNVALLANPIGLIILAILALIAIFVVAYKKVGWFHAGVDAAFKGIKIAIGWISTAVGAVISFVKSHWDLIFALLTGPIGLAVKWVVQHWGTIVAVFQGIISKIGPIIGKVKDILIFPFKTAFNAIATLWNNTVGKISFSLPSWIPGLGGKGFSMPKIPLMATGGIVTRPTLAMIGEAGPEAVIPLSRGGGLGGGPNISVQVNGFVGNEAQLAREIARIFNVAAIGGSTQTVRLRTTG